MKRSRLAAGVVAALFAGGAGFAQAITDEEVHAAQVLWGDGIVAIGEAYTNGDDYKSLAAELVDTLYAYDEGKVLFKPTLAADQQFRLTEETALSYFVTGVVDEDGGFAIRPWSSVRFENSGIIIDSDSAIAMGNYFFTDANTGEDTKVEYTFGYVRGPDGALQINLHHSGLPYSPDN